MRSSKLTKGVQKLVIISHRCDDSNFGSNSKTHKFCGFVRSIWRSFYLLYRILLQPKDSMSLKKHASGLENSWGCCVPLFQYILITDSLRVVASYYSSQTGQMFFVSFHIICHIGFQLSSKSACGSALQRLSLTCVHIVRVYIQQDTPEFFEVKNKHRNSIFVFFFVKLNAKINKEIQ